MCYRPIHIYNPSRCYCDDMPQIIRVPCNKCGDCMRVMHNEWFFRALVEFKHCRKHGGHVYFVTLTWNDKTIPRLVLPNGKKQLCFSKRDVHNFQKYLRIWLKRQGYLYKDIKFLICSEFGENTNRPHLHALLYFPFKVPNFTKFIRCIWKHGWILRSPDFGWEVKSIAGIDYVTKYVCKDFVKTFYENSELSKFLDTLPDEEKKDYLKSIKDFLPRHWQSSHFGESFIEESILKDDCTQHIRTSKEIARFLVDNKYTLVGRINGIYPIPRYYHTKLEKHVNKDLSKRIGKVIMYQTEIGEQVRFMKYVDRVMADVTALRLYSQNLDKYVPKKDCFCDLQDFYFKKKFFLTDYQKKMLALNPDHFDSMAADKIKHVKEKLGEMDLFRVALYRQLLRNYPTDPTEDCETAFARCSDIVANLVVPSAYPPEYAECCVVDPEKVRIARPIADMDNVKRLPSRACSQRNFMEYESLCSDIDWLDLAISLKKEFTYITQLEKNELNKRKQRKDAKAYESL